MYKWINLHALIFSCTHAGATPQRRDFSYPHSLTTTRPHSDLLDEFRTSARDKLMEGLPELPEDSESDVSTVLYSSMMSCEYSWCDV